MSTEKLDPPCKVAAGNSKVYKDECMYCFKTPESPDGIYICLDMFFGFCREHLESYVKKSSHVYYLNFCRKRVKKAEEAGQKSVDNGPDQKVSKLALGVEGGFTLDGHFDFDDMYTFVVYPHLDEKKALSEDLFTARVLDACNSLVSNEGAFRLQQLECGVSAWDGSQRVVTKHAHLSQIENPPCIRLMEAKCEEAGCDLRANLWLNLSDGSIKCGRSQYICPGTTTEGRNHAKSHYERMEGRCPLVVKLGTITSAGEADVFSYDEDESVIDPNLIAHLKHFGVDVTCVEKTEKSTLELELDMNQKWEFLALQEEGANLEKIYGPGYTGLINLGSSCYINSTMQALCLVPRFQAAYKDNFANIINRVPVDEFSNSLSAQLSKLISALESGNFSQKPSEEEEQKEKDSIENGIKPRQLRYLVGHGHPEFSTAKQQDAEEYIRYLLEKIDEESKRLGESSPSNSFRFSVEDRLEDLASSKVRYSTRKDVILSLRIPLEATVNKDQLAAFELLKAEAKEKNTEVGAESVVRPLVPLSACVDAFLSDQSMPDFKSPITNESTGAVQRQRFASFPDYFIIQAQKFTVGDDFTPKKLDVQLDIPQELDLEAFRAKGQQPGEQLLPEQADDQNDGLDPVSVEQITALGFTAHQARHALEQNNGDVAASAEWLFTNPNSVPPPSSRKRWTDPNAEKVDQLTVLGFSAHQAKYALRKHNGNVEVSAEWLFNNSDAVPMETDEVERSASDDGNEEGTEDGPASYRLIGFISHMGANCHSGHYVAHLYKDGRWVLFNDEKVAISQKPPFGFGYIYLYQRIGAS